MAQTLSQCATTRIEYSCEWQRDKESDSQVRQKERGYPSRTTSLKGFIKSAVVVTPLPHKPYSDSFTFSESFETGFISTAKVSPHLGQVTTDPSAFL